MLDLLITYVNFLILSLGYIVKRFAFFPPKPPRYISVKTDKEDEDAILFLIKDRNKKKHYVEIKFKLIEYRFIKMINQFNEELPLLLFIPPICINVCIIYSHGNSGDLGACILEFYDIAINTNCLVLSFEYPGFGDCMNQPLKESLFFRNMKIAYYFARNELHFQPEQIIFYGFSIGTGITFDLACHKEFPIAGMIIQSPILSVLRTMYDINKTPYFDLFNNCDKAKFLCAKTFFIHGNKDKVVPYIHGRILAKLIPQEYYYDFLTVKGADHNNLFKFNKDDIFKKIREFIKDLTGQFIDYNKLSLIELSSSDSTIDNNSSNINNKNKDENKNKINNTNFKNNNQTLNNNKKSPEKNSNIKGNNELNDLSIKPMEINNMRNSLNKNYQNNINNMDNNSYIQKMKENFVSNFFGYNPHNLQNDLNNYVGNNNTSLNNFISSENK